MAVNRCHFKQGSEGRHWVELLFVGQTGHERYTLRSEPFALRFQQMGYRWIRRKNISLSST